MSPKRDCCGSNPLNHQGHGIIAVLHLFFVRQSGEDMAIVDIRLGVKARFLYAH